MSQTCTNVMNRFLELDKHELLPLKVSAHILLCKKCRTQVRFMTMAEKTCKEPLFIPTEDSNQAITLLMKRIDPAYEPEKPIAHVSMKRWIIGGIAMVLGMLFFLIYSKSLNYYTLDIVFYSFFACAVSAYCAIFVGSNMDFFVKKIETLNEHNLTLKN